MPQRADNAAVLYCASSNYSLIIWLFSFEYQSCLMNKFWVDKNRNCFISVVSKHRRMDTFDTISKSWGRKSTGSCHKRIDEGRAASLDCSDSHQYFDRFWFDVRFLTINSRRLVRVTSKDKGNISTLPRSDSAVIVHLEHCPGPVPIPFRTCRDQSVKERCWLIVHIILTFPKLDLYFWQYR